MPNSRGVRGDEMSRLRQSGVLGRNLAIVVGVAAVVGFVSTQAAAFPGETAQEMVNRYGQPSLPTALQTPSVAALRAGKPSSVLVVWFQAKEYQPLSLPMKMEGRVVASFRFDGPVVLRKIERGERAGTWSDLRCDFENLFTTLSDAQFQEFLKLMETKWLINKKKRHVGPPYNLAEAHA